MRRPTAPLPAPTAAWLAAPPPNESGVYPIGVFSDAEVAMNVQEVEETLEAFAAIGRRLRGPRTSTL